MSPEIPGTFVFAVIALPIAFAWHSLVRHYLFASILATVNIFFLVSVLLLLSKPFGHYVGTLLVLAAGASCALSFAVGLPFLFRRARMSSETKN